MVPEVPSPPAFENQCKVSSAVDEQAKTATEPGRIAVRERQENHNNDRLAVKKRRLSTLGNEWITNGQFAASRREQVSEARIQIQVLQDELADMQRKDLEQRNLIEVLKDKQRQFEKGANEAGSLADDWLRRIDVLHITLRAKGEESRYEQVKIALLDTGITPDNAHAHYIECFEDFILGGHTMIDSTGHGTIGVELILKVFPSAKLYVGRVFEGATAKPKTADIMTEAIKRARKQWKVNIIVIASGFENDHSGMRNEIMKASADRILTFVAASNFGNITDIMFPARIHGHVMCMFASTGNVKSTNKHNPGPSQKTRYSFAVLGEEVLSSPLAPSRISGTSISTFIGAGIAGLIIDFSRHVDCNACISNRQDLLTINGMTAIFAAMSVSDGGYQCIAPWKILDSSDPNFCTSSRETKRKRICDIITEKLQKMERN